MQCTPLYFNLAEINIDFQQKKNLLYAINRYKNERCVKKFITIDYYFIIFDYSNEDREYLKKKLIKYDTYTAGLKTDENNEKFIQTTKMSGQQRELEKLYTI